MLKTTFTEPLLSIFIGVVITVVSPLAVVLAEVPFIVTPEIDP